MTYRSQRSSLRTKMVHDFMSMMRCTIFLENYLLVRFIICFKCNYVCAHCSYRGTYITIDGRYVGNFSRTHCILSCRSETYIIRRTQLCKRNVHILREMENKWQKPNVPIASSQQLSIMYIILYLVFDVNLPSYRSGRQHLYISSSCWVVGVVGGQQSIYNIII